MSSRKPLRKTHKVSERPPFECIALLLQGGGALGAYQAGVFQALDEAGLCPDWIAGISIGALNSAIIAGNAPEKRVEKLRAFWEGITDNTALDGFSDWQARAELGRYSRSVINDWNAGWALWMGIPGFFRPRVPPPWFHEHGSIAATSYYDTAELQSTLESLVDFDRINEGQMWLSVGAVNVKTGNFVYFDNKTHKIGPKHIMASGALPPGFPPVEIDGEYYWDGGLVSNTPLGWVVDSRIRLDTLVFQVDLWDARGKCPGSMGEVMTRYKDILYSSRTRAATDKFKYAQTLRHNIANLLDKLPPEMKDSQEAKLLAAEADRKVYNIIHLIHHANAYEGETKDYEFSRLTMQERWKAGYDVTVRTLRHPEVLQRPNNPEGVFTFDVSQQGRV